MNVKIEEKKGFRLVGYKEWTSLENGENFKKIPMMWQNLPQESYKKLFGLTDSEPSGIVGVCADMYNNGFEYWIAVSTTKECPRDMECLLVPDALWAVFEAKGALPKAIQDMWGKIYSEWLPTSGYEHAPLPEIEWYGAGDSKSDDYLSRIWIPVIKK